MSAALLTAGYDSVEWTPAHLDDLLAPCHAIACQQDLVTDPEGGLERTKRALERAHEAEIGIVDVVTGPNLWEPDAVPRDDEAAWSAALRALEAACAYAEPLGVSVCLEPCWGTLAHDAATARRALAAVPCAVTFDPSHFVLTGDDIPSLVREWAPRIHHVHLKDAFGRPGREGEDFHFCLLGEGRVPWPGLRSALEAAGYRGPLTVEFEAYRYYETVLGRDPAAAAGLAREQVRALLEAPQA